MPTCLPVTDYNPILHNIIGGPLAGGCEGCNELVPGCWRCLSYNGQTRYTDQGMDARYIMPAVRTEWCRPAAGRPVGYYQLWRHTPSLGFTQQVGGLQGTNIPSGINFWNDIRPFAIGVRPPEVYRVRAFFSDTSTMGPFSWDLEPSDCRGLGPTNQSVSLSSAGVDSSGNPLKNVSVSWSPPSVSLGGFVLISYNVTLYRNVFPNPYVAVGVTRNIGQFSYVFEGVGPAEGGSVWGPNGSYYVTISANYLNGVRAC
jgi:hypothetical protein